MQIIFFLLGFEWAMTHPGHESPPPAVSTEYVHWVKGRILR